MITISTELKPCPFCGGQPRTSVNYRQCGGGDLVLEFAVTCSHCGVRRSITEEMESAPFVSIILFNFLVSVVVVKRCTISWLDT